ncbi:MAG: hypothetical protein JXR31_12660 [Prolixibacteraceae bacterium]|nr:hypothetical protein [Prolixibacteraceae bacterium]MBN2775099.1 hypothetical protein [Prolixibacteraceae bacterium]
MRKLIPFILFFVFAGSLIFLVTASPLLTVDLSANNSFPLGTLITWMGITALPSFIYFAFPTIRKSKTRTSKIYKWVFLCLIFISALWGFTGLGLAGNWAFTFSDSAVGFRGGIEAGNWFWMFTFILVALPFITILIFFIHMLILYLISKRRS